MYPLKVTYQYTDNTFLATKWLSELNDTFAADFEVSSIYSKSKKDYYKVLLDNLEQGTEEYRLTLQNITSDGLSHPSMTMITHLSIADSITEGKVIVCSNKQIRELVLNYLTSTEKTQLWHNCVYDFKHIFYATGKLPKHYIDTQLLAKSILNDANQYKGDTGLKTLMAYAYSDWAMARDSDFVMEDMWNEDMLRYAATDACATYKLYQDIIEDLNEASS